MTVSALGVNYGVEEALWIVQATCLVDSKPWLSPE